MDTKSRTKLIKFSSLATKISAGFLVLLILSLLVVGIFFNSLVRDFVLEDAQDSLLIEARNMAGILASPSGMNPLVGQWGERHLFLISGSLVEGQYIITNKNLIVLDSSNTRLFPPGFRLEGAIAEQIADHSLKKGESLRFSTRESVVVAVPVVERLTGDTAGTVILLASLESLKIISARIVRLLLAVLLIAAVLGIVISIVLARGITKPLRLLHQNIQGIAAGDFSGRVDIQTGDEIEELGEAFNQMAGRLEEYDTARQRLIQNISHELKTPLMSIQGYAEAIRDGVVNNEEVDNSLDVIIRESQRLKRLVEDIIYLSKVESFEEEFRFEETELEELIHEAIETVAGISGPKNIKINFDSSLSTMVWADGEKLLRVLVNLLSNAVRHGESSVWIEVEERDGQVIVRVKDDGGGFSNQDLERLFERFYKGSGDGSGLGMTIARAIIQGHGGAIGARNWEKGAMVEFAVPLRKVE